MLKKLANKLKLKMDLKEVNDFGLHKRETCNLQKHQSLINKLYREP